jgi:hypothetical protein
MLKIAIAALCLAIPAQAQAQDYDYEYNGATVHRRIVTGQQCYWVGIDPNGFDWQHNGPCGRDDFGWIDQASMEPQKLHFRDGLTKTQLEHALMVWMFDHFHIRQLANQIDPPMCMSLPSNQQGNPWWWHKPPCRADDIGIIDKPDHIEFRESVTVIQLRYALALALDMFNAQPIQLSEFPEYRPLPL